MKGAKIGMFVNSLDGYQGGIVREVRETAAREGIDCDVFDAEHNAVRQAPQLVRFQYENQGRQLCVFVIPEADVNDGRDCENDPTYHLAARLLQKNVGWITLNHGHTGMVQALRTRFPHLPITLVAIDNIGFGRVHGQQLRRLLPQGGSVLCVRGNPLDSACADRTAGMQRELRDTAIAVTAVDGRWTEDVATTAVRKWISSPIRRNAALHAVVCQNDQMARATRGVLLNAAGSLGRPELAAVPVLGGDGLPEIGRPWVEDGTLRATVCVRLPGRPAVEQLARYWREGRPLSPETRLAVESYPALSMLSPLAH